MVPETRSRMVIHNANRLHPGVHDHWADKLEPTLLQHG